MADYKLDMRNGEKLSLGFSAEQFEEWRDRIECFLGARNLRTCLTDTAQTGQKECQVEHILRENVEHSQFKHHFRQAKHVSEVWTAIKARWAKSTIASSLILSEQLFSLQKPPNEGLLAFITRCNNLYCNLHTAGLLNDGMFVYKVTQILKEDPRYSTWADIVRAKGQLPNFNDLADQAREFFAAEIVHEQQALPSLVDGAFTATRSSAITNSSTATRSSKSPAKCDYCGYSHHTKADCRFYKRDNEKGELKPNGWYKKNHHQRHNKGGSHQRSQSHFTGALVTPAAFQAVTGSKGGFVIDSGASFHMVNDPSLLRNQQTTSVDITTANKELLRCNTKGEAVFLNHAGEQVLLREVLLLPALTCNLLSVKKASEAGLSVQFAHNSVTFTQPNGRLLLKGRSVGSLYELTGHALRQAVAAAAATVTQNPTAAEPSTPAPPPPPIAIGNANLRNVGILWHRRLGHIGVSSLAKMAANKRAIGLPEPAAFSAIPTCWSCVSGKATRNPFPVSTNNTSRPLELLHIDIAGPVQTKSAGGASFFITVLDDFTKFKAVKPIAKRSEATEFVKEVIQNWEAYTQLQTVALRHDRAKEFMAQDVQGWYKRRGIELQPTSTYSPQENGAAERLNRTLWETTLTLLADCGLPSKWWAEALAHVAHVHNVTSSTGGRTPWELLKGQEPDISTLRVFGAPCMVKVPDQRRHKLQFKTEPGRLLGFDLPNTKSYRVVLSSGKITRSRDIVPDETFQSQADQRMHELDIELTGSTYAPTPQPTLPPPATPQPTLPPPATPQPSLPPPAAAAPVGVTGSPAEETDRSAQTSAGHRSSRSNKGVPPVRLGPVLVAGTGPSFRLVHQGQKPR
jgi:transposase InsO family protein